MLKVRVMGEEEEIKWFQETLQKSKVVELFDFSDVFPCANTRKYYRAYGQVKKKKENKTESK